MSKSEQKAEVVNLAHEAFKRDVAELYLPLRKFGTFLSHNPTRGEDLAQDTIARAIENADKFTSGTNLRAWLFTVLRNLYYSQLRKEKREITSGDEIPDSKDEAPDPEQMLLVRAELAEVMEAMTQLSDAHQAPRHPERRVASRRISVSIGILRRRTAPQLVTLSRPHEGHPT